MDPILTGLCDKWGMDPALILAMVDAEGGREAFIRAVQCSVPVTNYAQAIEVACRSATHRMWEYLRANNPQGFVEYFGSKWAPRGVANDPHDLNQFWAKNVLAKWL
jgi:hypothetical protein